MSVLTIEIPAERRERLEAIAQQRGIGLATLLEQMSERAVLEYEAEERFRQRARAGDANVGLTILDKLDKAP